MAFNRGLNADFDAWAQAGNPGWSFDEVLPYFRKLERRVADDTGLRGKSGPMHVNDIAWDDPVCRAFVQGATDVGIPANPDYNGAYQDGIGVTQATIHRGRRVSSATAYLEQARSRHNLLVRTEAVATSVLFEARRAAGVCYMQGGERRIVRARRAVVLSCGAINTPRLLLASGIGPASMLQALGTSVVLDRPGVGENLQDHYLVKLIYRGRGFRSINQLASPPQLWLQAARWFFNRPSALALPAALLHYFGRTPLAGQNPDFQGIFSPASISSGHGGRPDPFPGMTGAVWQHRPRSRGFVRLASADPADKPIVQPNYLDHEEDRKTLVSACRIARSIFETDAMHPFVEAEIAPGESVRSDDEWLDFAYQNGSTVFHPAGSARMGPAADRMAVVDATLKVQGVDGLRVVDASVMPTLPSANTAAATMMIGEKGADLLRNASLQ
jgi:choline dehydrogenase